MTRVRVSPIGMLRLSVLGISVVSPFLVNLGVNDGEVGNHVDDHVGNQGVSLVGKFFWGSSLVLAQEAALEDYGQDSVEIEIYAPPPVEVEFVVPEPAAPLSEDFYAPEANTWEPEPVWQEVEPIDPYPPESVEAYPIEANPLPAPTAPELTAPDYSDYSAPNHNIPDYSSPESPAPVQLNLNVEIPVTVPPRLQMGIPGQINAIPVVPSSEIQGPGPAPVVVFSERSSGCRTTLNVGQDLPASICGQSLGQMPTNLGQGNGETWENWASPTMAEGGGQENWSQGFFSPSGLPPIPESPLEVAVQSLGQMLQPSLNVMDYYARTIRPQARTGNANFRPLFPLGFAAPVTSPFGWRIHPIFGTLRLHTGLDLGAEWGTPVHAALSGRVTISDFLGGYGLTVVLQHDDQDQETLYGHLSEVFVQPGDWVEQGEAIGRVGSTGNSTGPHLHFEVRQWTEQGWVALNPYGQIEGPLGEVVASNLGDGTDDGTGELARELAGKLVDGKQGLDAMEVGSKLDTPLGQAIVWLLTQLHGTSPIQDVAPVQDIAPVTDTVPVTDTAS